MPEALAEVRPEGPGGTHSEEGPDPTYGQVHLAAWLTAQRLNYRTMTYTATAPSWPIEGRVWIATVSQPNQAPPQVQVIFHTMGAIAAVAVFLVYANEPRLPDGDLALEVAQSFPYVRVVPDSTAGNGRPGVWLRAETPVDLSSDPPILPGTLSQLFGVVMAAVRQVFQKSPGAYEVAMPTSVQGTHVRPF